MRISLNGSDWLFKGFYGEDWVWRNAASPATRDLRYWYPGSVPGSVHHDLLQLGQTPDPYVGQNSLLVEWVPARTWIYKRSFQADPAWQGRRVTLHFAGIDYEAEFFLNGERLGQHRGMYTPVQFEVGRQLNFGGENLLAVVLHRAPDEEPQVSKTEYVRTHKSRMTYWWDFCPRMIHMGIWDEVYLEVTGPVQVADLWVRPILADDLTRAELHVAATLDAAAGATVEAELTIQHERRVVAAHRTSQRVAPGQSQLEMVLPVEQPALWWPNGHGEQPLYEAQLTLWAEGLELHTRRVTFGIRRVEAVQNEGAGPDSLPYTLVVNGKPIYIKGWNWVPIDVMYGVERPERLERLIELALRAHVNLLRVWGGGLIEKEAFYDLCDRHGIMVWQEFILSSSGIGNQPSAEPAYVEMMLREAEQIIPRKRNHPSLVIWCGGNELMRAGGVPLDDTEPVLGALRAVVRRLDPERHWLPTSPSGPAANNDLQVIGNNPAGQHDVHGPWEHQGLTAQYTLYNSATSLLHSEFGAEGMANLRALNATIDPDDQWPANRDNPVYFHRGAWWINEPLVQALFDGITEVEQLSQASQFLQYEALRYALEANRRRQWRNSGSIPWQFNEPYPNSWCTSAVDYYAEPKGGYWAVAKAYEPLAVTAKFPTQAWAGYERFTAELWLANDGSGGALELQARIIGASGRLYGEWAFAAVAPTNGAAAVGQVELDLTQIDEELFFLDLQAGAAANRYLFVKGADLRPMRSLPATSLAVEWEASGELSITNTGVVAALLLRLDDGRELAAPGWVNFSANLFSLLPGESRRVRVAWTRGASGPVVIKGWNTGGVHIA